MQQNGKRNSLWLILMLCFWACSEENKGTQPDTPEQNSDQAVESNDVASQGGKVDKHKDGRSEGRYLDGEKHNVWRYYDDSMNIDSVVLYNHGQKAFDLDPADWDFEDRIIEDEFVVSTPRSWETILDFHDVQREGYLFALKKNCDSSFQFCPVLTCRDLDLEDRDQMVRFYNKKIESLENSSEVLKVVEKEVVRAGDRNLYLVSFLLEKNGLVIGFTQTIFEIDFLFYELSCAAYNGGDSEFMKYRSLFLDMMQSFDEIDP